MSQCPVEPTRVSKILGCLYRDIIYTFQGYFTPILLAASELVYSEMLLGTFSVLSCILHDWHRSSSGLGLTGDGDVDERDLSSRRLVAFEHDHLFHIDACACPALEGLDGGAAGPEEPRYVSLLALHLHCGRV